jgi:hypothetical protein
LGDSERILQGKEEERKGKERGRERGIIAKKKESSNLMHVALPSPP